MYHTDVESCCCMEPTSLQRGFGSPDRIFLGELLVLGAVKLVKKVRVTTFPHRLQLMFPVPRVTGMSSTSDSWDTEYYISLAKILYKASPL